MTISDYDFLLPFLSRLRPRRAKEIEKETNVRRPRSIDADKKALLGSSSIRAGDGSKKAESGAPDQVDVEREQSDKVAIPPPSNPVAAAPPPPGKKGGLKRQRQETVDKEREDRDGAGADEKSRSTKKGRKAGGDQQKVYIHFSYLSTRCICETQKVF